MAAPTHEPELMERERTRVLPPYRVLIHDDPIHTYEEVVLAVHQTVPGKSYADGWTIATFADTTGQAVAVCAQEIAAYYRERFAHRYGLTSTIEPA